MLSSLSGRHCGIRFGAFSQRLEGESEKVGGVLPSYFSVFSVEGGTSATKPSLVIGRVPPKSEWQETLAGGRQEVEPNTPGRDQNNQETTASLPAPAPSICHRLTVTQTRGVRIWHLQSTIPICIHPSFPPLPLPLPSAICHLPPLDISNTRLTLQLLLSLYATLLACDHPTQHSSSRSFPTAKDPSGKPGPRLQDPSHSRTCISLRPRPRQEQEQEQQQPQEYERAQRQPGSRTEDAKIRTADPAPPWAKHRNTAAQQQRNTAHSTRSNLDKLLSHLRLLESIAIRLAHRNRGSKTRHHRPKLSLLVWPAIHLSPFVDRPACSSLTLTYTTTQTTAVWYDRPLSNSPSIALGGRD
ncbi:hypothetical protein CCHR01_19195 [Colletotrichum chrysophilum]|uniref:Uncharacterized protein n=1 Tax=Colletotrichum chrysophilum TaxID=1836956 RepID=A0AAD9A060_9PEZI|nr:hypothetical protein CCHR01_19195 [Colletotrichum chrysophilum]